MHPALKASLMKIQGYAKQMKGEKMKKRIGAETPGVDNVEESTEVDPKMGEAVPSEEKGPKEDADKKKIRKMLGMK